MIGAVYVKRSEDIQFVDMVNNDTRESHEIFHNYSIMILFGVVKRFWDIQNFSFKIFMKLLRNSMNFYYVSTHEHPKILNFHED